MSSSSPDQPRMLPPIYWSSAYFLSVAILFLWGYWAPFSVNVLEYVTLSDIVKTAAYPVASAFLFMAAGAVMGQMTFPQGFLPPGGGAQSPAGRWLRKFGPQLLTLYALATLVLFIFGPIQKWLIAPMLVALPVTIILGELKVLSASLPHDATRSAILLLLVSLPLFAFGHGRIKANDIITGKSYSYTNSTIEGHTVAAEAEPSQRPRYIGRAGDLYFFYLPKAASTLLVPHAQTKALELRHVEQQLVATAPSPTAPSTTASAPASAAR
jgi:hypothetical protein